MSSRAHFPTHGVTTSPEQEREHLQTRWLTATLGRILHFRHPISVSLMVAAGVAAYSTLGLVKFHTFRMGIYDLVIFDQGVRGYASFSGPLSHVKGYWETPGTPFSLLGDHFSPILALIAPLYWIYDGPETLIVAQATLFSLAAVPLWVLTRRALTTPAAYLISTAYLVSWPIAEAASFHFHEYAFAPLLTALMFERISAGRLLQATFFVVPILAVKEDMGVFVAGLGAGLALMRGRRGFGIALFACGALYVYLATRLIIPSFGGQADRYWYYSQWGGDPWDAISNMISRPHEVVSTLFSPDTKAWTVLLLLGPLLFLSPASPYMVAPGAMLLMRMLATDPGASGWWSTSYHYNAAIIMALMCAAVDGLARIRRRIRGAKHNAVASYLPAGMAGAMIATVPFFALGNLFSPAWYQPSERTSAAVAALAVVPNGVLVESANNLGPHISARTHVVAWAEKPAKRPERAPWVVADLDEKQPHFSSVHAQVSDVVALQERGYQRVFSDRGYAVLCAPTACR
ncbi:Uncharacterized membrane protein [Sinosporangium album]|uniref:Uncharacterized membrane protein n=1 Tax=Sinosporangium album TaxID=504805 RepID=A0A1G7YWC2_9ACTN|nr:DUF2079 domain-containing protein [Sinosporangium album]SDH00539.1 Uncharacterized membrane protein [Sinosporangium album]